MTIRWKFRDTVTGEVYTVPINPDSMSSVDGKKAVRHGRGRKQDSRVNTILSAPPPQAWEFGGAIRTKAHYDALENWAERPNAVEITDHLGRTFRVVITDFLPVDRNPTPLTPWRLRYTVKTNILKRLP